MFLHRARCQFQGSALPCPLQQRGWTFKLCREKGSSVGGWRGVEREPHSRTTSRWFIDPGTCSSADASKKLPDCLGLKGPGGTGLEEGLL